MSRKIRRLLVWLVAFYGLFALWGYYVASGQEWTATSYCKGSVTASGLPVRRGIVASDPRVLPLGSIVRVTGTGRDEWDGIYSVQDTGPAVQGTMLDLYFWSCDESLDFGRRAITVEVLRSGWAPNDLVTTEPRRF